VIQAFLSYQYREVQMAKTLAASFDVTNLPLDNYDGRMRHPVASDDAAKSRETLQAAIDASEVLIVIVGPTTATSSWVTWEIEQAQAAGKAIVVARDDEDDMLPAVLESTSYLQTTWRAEDVKSAALSAIA
jgi:hypothetical protein